MFLGPTVCYCKFVYVHVFIGSYLFRLSETTFSSPPTPNTPLKQFILKAPMEDFIFCVQNKYPTLFSCMCIVMLCVCDPL